MHMDSITFEKVKIQSCIFKKYCAFFKLTQKNSQEKQN